jgi:hypothetical protein
MKEKNEHGLSEAELFLADALSDGSWEQTDPDASRVPEMRPADPQPDFLYFAMKVHGGRVEISGEPTAFMAKLAADIGVLITKALGESKDG